MIDLFAGAGGLSLGFEMAGFQPIWANDNNKWACETYEANFGPGIMHCCDIKGIGEFPKADIVVGGYPCQGFSLAGKRLVTDPRNKLYLEYARCLREVAPKFFVAENVPGMLTLGGGKIIEAMVHEFENINGGYDVAYTHSPLNAKWFGVPQDRKRVFIVGVRKGLNFKYGFPKPTHGPGLKPYVTLRDAIGSMPEPKEGEVYDAGYSSIYMSRNRRRGWGDVSFTIQAGARHAPQHPSSSPMEKRRISETPLYGKIGLKGENEAYIWTFSGKHRRLSYKECAAIQSFPSNFVFKGPLIEKYKQIGNAVPPLLAKAVASGIIPYFQS